MKKFLVDSFFYALFAAIGAGLGATIFDLNVFDKIRFWARPVVKMQGILVKTLGPNHVIIGMYGEKLRGEECVYKGIQAFGDRISGLPVDLNSKRMDRVESGITKPEGTYDIGLWEVWPVEGIYRIRVKVSHECGKSKVSTEIASISLEGN